MDAFPSLLGSSGVNLDGIVDGGVLLRDEIAALFAALGAALRNP